MFFGGDTQSNIDSTKRYSIPTDLKKDAMNLLANRLNRRIKDAFT
jgi:hypothetical protein